MGESSESESSEVSLEEILKEISNCDDKLVELIIKKEKVTLKKSQKNYTTEILYGKILYCEGDEIHFTQGINGKKNYDKFRMIPFSAILRATLYFKGKCVKRKDYEQ